MSDPDALLPRLRKRGRIHGRHSGESVGFPYCFVLIALRSVIDAVPPCRPQTNTQTVIASFFSTKKSLRWSDITFHTSRASLPPRPFSSPLSRHLRASPRPPLSAHSIP